MDYIDLVRYGIINTSNNCSPQLGLGIEVVSCSVLDLFNCSDIPIPDSSIKGNLLIPEYQRPYVWKEKELQKLIRDIHEYQASTDNYKALYYLGSIILHKDATNQLNIIDGQQRITTILLWYSLHNPDFDFSITYKSPVSIDRIQKNLIYLKQQHELPKFKLDDFNVTLVVTNNEDDAYTFFETQNTGGVRLTGADIIKSHHLRAIESTALLNSNAKEWEQLSHLSYVIDLMAKARYWNCLQWRYYPSFRNEKQLKDAVVDEFTERTKKENKNISYRQVELRDHDSQQQIWFNQKSKSVRQPLYDGINSIQYFKEMVECYESVFVSNTDYKVSDKFYLFRDKLLKGWNGTIFLKELFELATVLYVNKFGYSQLYEFALWTFRYIYSKRITNDRTVREDSIFKFVYDNKLLDIIANVYTHDEVIDFLTDFNYEFNEKNIETYNVKGRFIAGLAEYFSSDFKNTEQLKIKYDFILKRDIYAKLK
jgi:hypothetical protein